MKLIAVAVAVVALISTSCGGTRDEPATQPSSADVTIRGFLFSPEQISTRSGEPVRFENRDEILHTVTSGEPGDVTNDFDHELPTTGAVAEVRISEPGTYPYFCTRHEHMRGTIEVTG